MELVAPVIVARDMPGLRILGRRTLQEHSTDEDPFRVDYRFEELVVPIQHLIGDFYWLADRMYWFSCEGEDYVYADQSALDELTIQLGGEFDDLLLYSQGFLPRFSDFVPGNCESVYGVTQPIDPSNLRIWMQQMPDCCELYFSLVGGAYWEVYSTRSEILRLLKAAFAITGDCALKDKKS